MSLTLTGAGKHVPVVASPNIYDTQWFHALSSGDRTSTITVTTDATLGGGTINNLVDGGIATNTTDSTFFNSGQSSKIVQFDFGATAVCITAFAWIQDNGNNHGTWVWEYESAPSTWTQIGSSFSLGGVNVTQVIYNLSHNVLSTKYRLRQTSGTTTNNPWLREVYFRIGTSIGSANPDAAQAGDRTSAITISTTATLGAGTINNLIDGNATTDANDCIAFTAETTREIKFDFGTGKVVTGFVWFQAQTIQSLGTWVLEGSHDDSSYTGIGSSFTLGNAPVDIHDFSANSTSYRYVKLRQTAGTLPTSARNMEIEFRIA